MCFTVAEIHAFLVLPWSQPLRAVCPSLSEQARQFINRKARVSAPKWARPQYFQRWLGETFARRLAQPQCQPGTPRYRFGRSSEPCWSETATHPIAMRPLRPLPEHEILWYMGMGLERLYRITQTPQWEIGEDLWTQTFLSASQYLSQLYGELKRRYKAQHAREVAQHALDTFLTWDAEMVP